MGSSSRSKTMLHSPLGSRRSLACVCGGPCQYQKQATNAASGPLGVCLRASTMAPVNYYKMAVQKNPARTLPEIWHRLLREREDEKIYLLTTRQNLET